MELRWPICLSHCCEDDPFLQYCSKGQMFVGCSNLTCKVGGANTSESRPYHLTKRGNASPNISVLCIVHTEYSVHIIQVFTLTKIGPILDWTKSRDQI